MSKFTTKCIECRATLAVESVTQFNATTQFVKYTCGHSAVISSVAPREDLYSSIISQSGKRPYPFQITGAGFAAQSNVKCLIADEMGLGKTIEALMLLRVHPTELLPCLVICKSAVKTQWFRECEDWTKLLPQVIETSRDIIFPGAQVAIVSFDIIRRFNGRLIEMIRARGFKSIIMDECQQIKSTQSKRTVEVRDLTREVEHIIALSGTPIKNNAAEYFSILNILHPEIFSNYSRFVLNWCDSYWSGYGYKVGGLRNPKLFAERTKDFIIRRTREEVLPDLPKITRNFRFHELGEEVEVAYQVTFKEFQDYYNNDYTGSSFERQTNILAFLSKMRHLAGIAKIAPTLDFLTEFLMSTDRRVAVFTHHLDVAQLLYDQMTALCADGGMERPMRLAAGDGAERVEEFKNSKSRVLIASTLAAGEGLNLQFMHDMIMMERQWNPANEEQAECRFIRIGQLSDQVTGTYMVAVGTVDEFFSELVEKKRGIFKQAMSGEDYKWDESSLIKELTEIYAMKGGKRWGW